MNHQTTTVKEVVTLRLPRSIVDGLRALAAREGETQSVMYRRLLRRALQQEGECRRDVSVGDRVG